MIVLESLMNFPIVSGAGNFLTVVVVVVFVLHFLLNSSRGIQEWIKEAVTQITVGIIVVNFLTLVAVSMVSPSPSVRYVGWSITHIAFAVVLLVHLSNILLKDFALTSILDLLFFYVAVSWIFFGSALLTMGV